METGVLVLLATTEWGVREGAYGVFIAAGAVGNLIGSLGANSLVRKFGSARTLIGAALISGVGYLIMALAQGWELAGPAFALVGFAVGVGSVVAISLRQRLTPDDLMGRVGGAWRGLVWGAAPVGALAAGTLASIGGLRLPLVLAGTLQCAVALLLARPLLRSLREGTRPSAVAASGSRVPSARRTQGKSQIQSTWPRLPAKNVRVQARSGFTGTTQSQVLNKFRRYWNRVRGWRRGLQQV